MPASVQITFLICATIILVFVVGPFLPGTGDRLWRKGYDRYGKYQMLLGALSDLEADPASRGGWQRLSQAANTVGLIAPQSVVAVVMECCEEMRRSGRPLTSPMTIRLMLELRRDLRHPFRDDPKTFDFRVIPSAFTKHSA